MLDAGIEVHGQVVVCPGVNDGAVLDDTLLGVLDRFPALATLGVVPARRERAQPRSRDAPPHARRGEAVVDIVEEWQARFRAALGRRLVYVSDEYYLLAERAVPRARRVRRLPATRERHRHGAHVRSRGARRARGRRVAADRSALGLLRLGRRRSRRRLPRPETYRGTSAACHQRRRCRARTDSWDVSITGEHGARVLEPLLDELPGPVRLLTVKNAFFGGNIGVTGLLTGADVAAALEGSPSTTATCCPTSRSRAAGSSTARPSPSCRGRRDRADRRRLAACAASHGVGA